MPDKLKGTKGKFRLCEIFTLAGEEVFNEDDIHTRYCINPIFPWKSEPGTTALERRTARQAEIAAAERDFMDDGEPDETPADETPATDGHPYFCFTCGAGVIGSADGKLILNFKDDKPGTPHTCNLHSGGGIDTRILVARQVGTKRGLKVKFVDISDRMDIIKDTMQEIKDTGADVVMQQEAAELGAEYLILHKRLYTEIPD
jgi:hypothetical protein